MYSKGIYHVWARSANDNQLIGLKQHDELLQSKVSMTIIASMPNPIYSTKLEPSNEILEKGNLKWSPSFDAEGINVSETIGKLKITAVYDEELARYACKSLTAEPSNSGKEITGASLRELRIAEAIQTFALEHIWVEAGVVKNSASLKREINGVKHISASDALKSLPKVSGRTTDEDVKNATIAFAIAQVSGMPTLSTIGKSLGTSQSTAQRLVARARELGYLDG